AETLFAMQKDRLAGNGHFAEPERLRIMPLRARAFFPLPAPFILFQAGRELAEAKLQQAGIPLRVDVIRLDRSGLQAGRERVAMPSKLGEDVAAVVKHLDVKRLDRQRPLITGKRFLVAG